MVMQENSNGTYRDRFNNSGFGNTYGKNYSNMSISALATNDTDARICMVLILIAVFCVYIIDSNTGSDNISYFFIKNLMGTLFEKYTAVYCGVDEYTEKQ